MRIKKTLSVTLTAAALAAASLTLAACDSPPSESAMETQEAIAVEETTPPVITEQPIEPAAPSPSDAVPVETLPPEVRTSEETVQPDSETLFY